MQQALGHYEKPGRVFGKYCVHNMARIYKKGNYKEKRMYTYTHAQALSLSLSLFLSLSHTHTHTHTQSYALRFNLPN